MSEGYKPMRLSKVANEFGVGVSTIIEFLNKQGIEVESKPTTKIDEEVFKLLAREFQSEKTALEESKHLELKSLKKETISIDTKNVKTSRRSDEQKEVLIKNVENVSTGIEDIVNKEKKKIAVKVVGKVELEEKKKEEKTKPKEDKKVEVKTKEKETKPKEQAQSEFIKIETEKLQGPKVVDKIDLPVEKKKPVASSSEDADIVRQKKKRKRIRQGQVEKTAFSPKSTRKKGHKHKEVKPDVSEEEIQAQIRDTLARLSGTGKSKASKYRRAKRQNVSETQQEELEQLEKEKNIIKVTEFVTANELATMMDVDVNEVITACMTLGLFVSINQRLDAETLVIVAEEFGFKIDFVSADLHKEDEEEAPIDLEKLVERPPIITVMGHVDHGKTSLLDYIRKTNVIAGESGGITQHIGAYSMVLENEKRITFLDTPGHEAFTAMRARGAQITDLVIIVIAADDKVMPQTKEAINHAQAAGVPMIFAINKIDKEGADPERIKEELSQMNIMVEDWGGKYQSQEISAKKGLNIDDLLDKVLLEAEMLELKADPTGKAEGTVIESELDKGRGYVNTILVQKGSLHIGDIILSGSYSGRVKAMYNERGQTVDVAGPSTPVSVLGFDGASTAGDKFKAMDDEKEARSIASRRMQLTREQGVRTQKHIMLGDLGRRMALGKLQELKTIIKADVDGSAEALSDSLQKLSTDKIKVDVIHKSVGQISESDVLLASASDAIIIGFQVRPSASARKIAEKEGIDIRLHSVIYDAIEEIKAAMEGMLSPLIEEKIVCNLEVRDVFKITKVGTIAGCYVTDGKIHRNTKVRLIRDGIVIYTGKLGSLKRFKDDVKEVGVGYECGLNIENFNDVKTGDMIEGYDEVEVKQTL